MPRKTKHPQVLLALTRAATATAVGVQPRDVDRAVDSGILPVYTIGARVRILTADIEAWIRSWPRQQKRQRKPKVSPDV